MTNSASLDDKNNSTMETTIKMVSEMIKNKQLKASVVCVGNNVNQDELAKFVPDRYPIQIQDLEISKFFVFLSEYICKLVSPDSVAYDRNLLDLFGGSDTASVEAKDDLEPITSWDLI